MEEEGSIFGTLILMRAVGEVIYVGRGTQQGIKVRDDIVNWESFAEELKNTASKTIYVAVCYSENIAKIAEKNSSQVDSPRSLSKRSFTFFETVIVVYFILTYQFTINNHKL
ncbi:MAG: hypothetical protein ACTSXW_07190 [Candidatus Baldrarchaeia archaeon]